MGAIESQELHTAPRNCPAPDKQYQAPRGQLLLLSNTRVSVYTSPGSTKHWNKEAGSTPHRARPNTGVKRLGLHPTGLDQTHAGVAT